MNNKKEKRNKMLELIAHLCVGLSVLMKGIDKIEHPGKELVGALLIFIGIVILVGSFIHEKLEHIIGHFKLYIFGLESIVLILLGYSYMVGGSRLMFYFYYLAGLMFIAAIFIHLKYVIPKEKREKAAIVVMENQGDVNSIASQEEKI